MPQGIFFFDVTKFLEYRSKNISSLKESVALVQVFCLEALSLTTKG